MRTLQVAALMAVCLLTMAEGQTRRLRVRPARPVQDDSDQDEQPQQVEYYAQPHEREEQVVVSNADVLNGLYGRALERGGTDAQYTRPLSRAALIAQPQSQRQARVKDTPKEPPVQTIRNYSNVNDDGSFTFGYEAADGSFKEETRGTDCVVRGKYGYVDPDGNKREFTYVSGNPCDPNAPNQEEEKEIADESAEENVPQNLPRRPLRPVVRPAVSRPTTTLFQQSFNSAGAAQAEDDEQEQQLYVQPTPVRARLPARPLTIAERPQQQFVRVTPRPSALQSTTLPATTYRPQLLVSVTPRPNVVYTKHSTLSRPSPSSSPLASSTIGSVDFESELKRFQLENNAVTTPRTIQQTVTPSTHKAATPTGQPIYTSELVYDPSSGQYNTVVYQQLPKNTGDFNLKTKHPQYVPNPDAQPLLRHPQPAPVLPQQQPSSLLQQQLFQQQKQTLFHQSADLYNQQRQQQLQTQHRFQPPSFSPTLQVQQHPTLSPASTKPITSPQKFQQQEQPQRLLPRPSTPQQFYYFAPQLDSQSQGISAGQIDAFLRGHNLQF